MGFRRPLARRPLANLLGAAARTAVIAGTASAVTGAVRRRNRRSAVPPQHAMPAQQVPAQQGPTQQIPAQQQQAGITDEQLGRLERLAELQKAGVLSEKEFVAQKAAILGTGA